MRDDFIRDGSKGLRREDPKWSDKIEGADRGAKKRDRITHDCAFPPDDSISKAQKLRDMEGMLLL